MQSKIMDHTLIVRADRGEELLAKIREACEAHGVRAGVVSGIGAVDRAVCGAYIVGRQEYVSHEYTGDMEILALIGNVSEMDGAYYGHFHVTLGREDGSVVGGHANELHISATSEVFIQIIDGAFDRSRDETVGLNVIDLEKPVKESRGA